jgi:hypothetical protein
VEDGAGALLELLFTTTPKINREKIVYIDESLSRKYPLIGILPYSGKSDFCRRKYQMNKLWDF